MLMGVLLTQGHTRESLCPGGSALGAQDCLGSDSDSAAYWPHGPWGGTAAHDVFPVWTVKIIIALTLLVAMKTSLFNRSNPQLGAWHTPGPPRALLRQGVWFCAF